MRTLFIGDVHGCREELERLLEACAHRPEDRVVLLGDLVAKGPDSAGVVALARELGALAVLGNHDVHALKWHGRDEAEWKSLKRDHRVVLETLSGKDWRYLEALPRYLQLPELGVLAVHAGFVPGVPLEAQAPGDLINMRSLKPDGTASKRIEEGVPWASRWPGPEVVLFGHDAVRGLQRHPHAWGLDTGCVYGGKLSALLFPEQRLVQVDAGRVYKEVDEVGPNASLQASPTVRR